MLLQILRISAAALCANADVPSVRVDRQRRVRPALEGAVVASAPVRVLAFVIGLLACASWSGLVAAQAPDAAAESGDERLSVDVEARNTTMARALFDEGLQFVDSEQWQQAQDRFGRVLSLRYSAVAAYNWGLALARLGRGVVAASALRRLLTDPNLDPNVREHASALLRDVEARFAWLNVHVLGDCQGCNVYLNDQLWPWAAVGVFVPVDAGNYALRLRLGTTVLSEQRLSIAETERVEATLAAADVARLAGGGAAVPSDRGIMSGGTSQPAALSRHSLLLNGWFWGAMGVLVVGAGGMILLAAQ